MEISNNQRKKAMIEEQVMKHTPELYPPRVVILRAVARLTGIGWAPGPTPQERAAKMREKLRMRRLCGLCGHPIGKCAMPVAEHRGTTWRRGDLETRS